jgi:hypothetical protein
MLRSLVPCGFDWVGWAQAWADTVQSSTGGKKNADFVPGAVAVLKNALENKPGCADLFTGGASKAEELLDGLAAGTIGVSQFGVFDSGDALTLGRPGTEINFADGSPLFGYVDININSSTCRNGLLESNDGRW